MPNPNEETAARMTELKELGSEIQSYIDTYTHSMANGNGPSASRSDPVLSRVALGAQRRLVAAAGRLNSLVLPPQEQLILLSAQHLEARALHIVVAADVAGVIKKAGGEQDIGELAESCGLEGEKLGRVLRLLCDLGVFTEVRDGVFSNNSLSAELTGDENFRAFVITFGFAMFSAMNELPAHLFSPILDDAPATALGKTMRFNGAIFEWFGQRVHAGDLRHGRNGLGVPYDWSVDAESEREDTSDRESAFSRSFRSGYPGAYGTFLRDAVEDKRDADLIDRPELAVHRMAMVSQGRLSLMGEYEDYPWGSLGAATVVDVGSGIGGFSLQLSKLFPKLKIVLQDVAPTIKQAETLVWPKQHPQAIESGKVQFMPHDFFTCNPVKGAEVYYLRCVLQDWSNEDAGRILSNIKMSMGYRSRVLISEIIMPSAILPNSDGGSLGSYHRYKHILDMAMMCGMNARGRSEALFRQLAERAGLVVKTVWECRGHGGLVELVLPRRVV